MTSNLSHKTPYKPASVEFKENDLDFSSLTKEQLIYLCDNRIIHRSLYPKLVLFIANISHFNNWLQSDETTTIVSERDKIECIQSTIDKYLKHARSGTTVISLKDSKFWQELVDTCWNYKAAPHKPCPRENITKDVSRKQDQLFEEQVISRVQKTLKPYRYWKLNETPSTQNTMRAGTQKKQRTIVLH